MNQQSSIEFELAQSTEVSQPTPKGPPVVDPTVVAPGGIDPGGVDPAAVDPAAMQTPVLENTELEAPAADPASLANSGDQPALIGKPQAPSFDSDVSVDLRVPDTSEVSESAILRNELGQSFADKPFVAGEHNTVISTQPKPLTEPASRQRPTGQLSASAEELQASLFGSREAGPNGKSSLRVGNMDVYEKIGAGGMGAVFRAIDTELSREVALKVLHPRVSADPALVARFRNEARACAQLNHDNIARVFTAGDHDGVHYIAYEYAAGKTIKELIEIRGQLATSETINYAIQATLALGHIESAGIIHRDIKPSNIILTHTGRIKVVDLGLARRETEDSIADLTVAGTTLGTFDYLAPEQARDASAADIRSDIYSLGCTLYHMLTGSPPYPDGTAVQKMLDHQGKDPPDVRKLNKTAPKQLAEIVQTMMTTSPDDRYQAPGQLLADLIHLASQLGLRSVPAEGIVWRRVPVTKVRDISGNLFLAGAIAVICVTALIMHFLPAGTESNDGATVERWLSPADSGDESNVAAVPDPLESGAAAAGVQADVESNQVASVDIKSPGEKTVTDDSSAGTKSTGNSSSETAAANDAATVSSQAQQLTPFLLKSLTTETRYRSLVEAWDKAVDGDIIELDFDGPAPSLTTPLPRRSVGQASPRIAIRAARERSPVIVLAVRPEAVSSASKGSFFELTSDLQLEISGVHFQVDLSAAIEPDDDWTVFDFSGVNRVRMSRCTIEVTNPRQVPLSLFRFRDGGSLESAGDVASVQLENSAVRGATDLVRLQAQLECEVALDQSAFALDGCLVRNLGSNEMLTQGSLKLTMDHCTTISNQAMIAMKDRTLLEDLELNRTLPRVDVVSRSNVFASLPDVGTLVSMEGNQFRSDLQELLTWNGVNNYYNDRIVVFWAIESGLTEIDNLELDFDSWQKDWNRQQKTEESYPQIFDTNVWAFPEQFEGLSADSLNQFPVRAFELKSTYFSSSGGGLFPLEKGEQLPGVSSHLLGEFPSTANTKSVGSNGDSLTNGSPPE
ncbi:MAG: protein kinase [Fuerstiella sp.]